MCEEALSMERFLMYPVFFQPCEEERESEKMHWDDIFN